MVLEHLTPALIRLYVDVEVGGTVMFNNITL